MKSRYRYLFKVIIPLLFLSCKVEPEIGNFNIKVRDFDGSYGYWLTYQLNQDSIRINYNCDFENCKDTIVYSKKLSLKEKQKFYSYLLRLRHLFDTLKSKYIYEGYDGLNLKVSISGDSIADKRITLERYVHPEIENLMQEIDKLISNRKYWYNKEQ